MRYWIYLAGEVPGQFEPKDLVALPGFTDSALVCPCDGELSERKWQPAGAIGEIVRAIEARPPAPPPQALGAAQTLGPDQIIDETNIKLFRHVSRLMKELEAGRSDRILVEVLQKNLAQSEEALKAAQEELKRSKDRGSDIAELEKRAGALEENLSKARAEAADRLREIDDLKGRLEREEREIAAAHANLTHIEGEKQAVSDRLSDLNSVLAEKDFSLTKALAALSRVEKELGQLTGHTEAGHHPHPKGANGKLKHAHEMPPPIPAEPSPVAAEPPEAPTEPPPAAVEAPPILETKAAAPLAPQPVVDSGSEDTSLQSELADLLKSPTPVKVRDEAPRPLMIDDTVPPPVPAEDEPSHVEVSPPWRQALDSKLADLKAKLFGRK